MTPQERDDLFHGERATLLLWALACGCGAALAAWANLGAWALWPAALSVFFLGIRRKLGAQS